MAKGLYLMSDGQVLVEYGKRRRVPIPSAQYRANGYKPPCDKLPPEVPRKARKEFASSSDASNGDADCALRGPALLADCKRQGSFSVYDRRRAVFERGS
jgi:hypothetical protein